MSPPGELLPLGHRERGIAQDLEYESVSYPESLLPYVVEYCQS